MTRAIINFDQAQILRFLETTVDATNEWIRTQTQIMPSAYHRNVTDLRERELINSHRPMSNKVPMRHKITDAGRLALDDYIAHNGTQSAKSKVAPAKVDKLSGTYYTPTNVYYRNNGHTHLPSRGIGA